MEEFLKLLADAFQQQTVILKEIAQGGPHTKAAVANTNTATLLHGATGLFSGQGIERDVITAVVRPQGLAATLPAFGSVYTDPRFASITGVSGDIGSEPTNPCDDAPAGYLQGCNLTAQFGRVQRDTQTIEIDQVILRRNRGDLTDLLLRGQLLGGVGGITTPGNLTQDQILNIVTKSEMVQVGVRVERKLNTLTWQGSPSNNTAGGGYKEFPGLDNQIATGQVDADTGTTCPALDSDIKDFAYDLVGGNGRDIVEYLSMLEFYLRYNAERMGLTPVEWVVVMRPELWFELSAVWPCSYLSHKCSTDAGTNPIVINDNNNVAMRDAMRNGMYIDINGNRYPVVTDTGIYEHTNITSGSVPAGQYASSIYMVPLRITGNFPVTYWEYVDYRQAVMETNLLNGQQTFWTDDGRFFWNYDQNGFCFKLQAKTEPRVVLRTPQLAGKVQNVRYSPLQHLRDADPDNPYNKAGGVSTRTAPAKNAVWLS